MGPRGELAGPSLFTGGIRLPGYPLRHQTDIGSDNCTAPHGTPLPDTYWVGI